MPTPKHSVVVKTIIWYLKGTNSQATSMQDSLKPGTLYNLSNPHQPKDWYGVSYKESPTLNVITKNRIKIECVHMHGT